MWQLCHYRGVWDGKDCIGLFQFFHIVALFLHPLHNHLDVVYRLIVLLCRGRWYTVDVYPPFPAVVTAFFCSRCARWKKTCTSPKSWGRKIVISNLRCCRLTPPSVSKGWSLWKSSWLQILSGLLLALIISPFPTVQLVGKGVPRGCRASSSWLCSPWGWSRRSPRIWWKYVVAWWVPSLAQTCQLVNQWGQEYWYHRRDNLLLQRFVHGGVLVKQRLVLSELFSSEHLFLGAPHAMRVVTWVVWRYKRESCLFHVLLGRHQQRDVSVLASYKVQHHGRCIPTDQLM